MIFISLSWWCNAGNSHLPLSYQSLFCNLSNELEYYLSHFKIGRIFFERIFLCSSNDLDNSFYSCYIWYIFYIDLVLFIELWAFLNAIWTHLIISIANSRYYQIHSSLNLIIQLFNRDIWRFSIFRINIPSWNELNLSNAVYYQTHPQIP